MWSLVLLWRGRDPWARRDYLTLSVIALSMGSAAFTTAVDYRRVERRVVEDLARQRRAREIGERGARQSTRSERRVDVPVAALVPAGRSAAGCVAHLGLLAAGWVQAAWDYRNRPDREQRRAGPGWQWRPGPAWSTAWSWQQLPVNATSTAPRGRKIAYERRQLLTLEVTGTAVETANLWDTQLRPALIDGDWARLAAGLPKITAKVVNTVADYRRVLAKVDAVIAAGSATIVGSFTAQLLMNRDRPETSTAGPPEATGPPAPTTSSLTTTRRPLAPPSLEWPSGQRRVFRAGSSVDVLGVVVARLAGWGGRVVVGGWGRAG